jgi:hypothetical protein
MADQTRQWCAYGPHVHFQLALQGLRDIAKPPRDVNAVADFGERRLRDVSKMQPVAPMPPCKSFNDIRGD